MILLLELFLVKDLNGQNAVFRRSSVTLSMSCHLVSLLCLQVEDLIPVWVEGLLDYGGRLRLLASDGSNGERVRKA